MSVSPELNPVQRARSGTVSWHREEAHCKFAAAVFFCFFFIDKVDCSWIYILIAVYLWFWSTEIHTTYPS